MSGTMWETRIGMERQAGIGVERMCYMDDAVMVRLYIYIHNVANQTGSSSSSSETNLDSCSFYIYIYSKQDFL